VQEQARLFATLCLASPLGTQTLKGVRSCNIKTFAAVYAWSVSGRQRSFSSRPARKIRDDKVCSVCGAKGLNDSNRRLHAWILNTEQPGLAYGWTQSSPDARSGSSFDSQPQKYQRAKPSPRTHHRVRPRNDPFDGVDALYKICMKGVALNRL
jgi:hypothetical protein